MIHLGKQLLASALALVVTSASIGQELSYDDLKVFFNSTQARWETTKALRLTFLVRHEQLDGQIEMLEWEKKVRKTWLERGWASDDSIPLDDKFISKTNQELVRLDLQQKAFEEYKVRINSAIDAWFFEDNCQIRWRNLPDDYSREPSDGDVMKLFPDGPITAGMLEDDYSELRFISSTEDPANVLAWPGMKMNPPVFTILDLGGMPRVGTVPLPMIGSRQASIPFKTLSMAEELFSLKSKLLKVSLDRSNHALAEGSWTSSELTEQSSDLPGTWHGLRATIDMNQGGIPVEIHSLIMFDKENKRPELPGNNEAWRSYFAEIGNFEPIGFFPRKIEIIRRKSPMQLVMKGKQDPSSRADGMADRIETEKWSMRVVNIEQRPELTIADFFAFKIPEEAITINRITGKSTTPKSLDQKLQKEATRVARSASVWRNWKVVLLWGLALMMIIFAGIHLRKR